METPIVPIATPDGYYTIRSLGDGLELFERCYASGLGFHAGDIQVAVDNRNDPAWYRNIQTAPLYRRDLDLVAIAPEGAIAAFCTIWFGHKPSCPRAYAAYNAWERLQPLSVDTVREQKHCINQ